MNASNNANISIDDADIAANIGAIFDAITTAIDNGLINKEPAGRLIDKRLDKVKDWDIIENGSNINEIIGHSSILVKNKYNR